MYRGKCSGHPREEPPGAAAGVGRAARAASQWLWQRAAVISRERTQQTSTGVVWGDESSLRAQEQKTLLREGSCQLALR